MNIADFSDEQAQGLLELLVLGMYADGHLASTEDTFIKSLAGQLGLQSGYDIDRAIDEAVTRVTRKPRTPDAIRHYLVALKDTLSTSEARDCALTALEEIVWSDERFTDEERKFTNLVREVFEL